MIHANYNQKPPFCQDFMTFLSLFWLVGIPDEIEDSFEAIMQGLAIDNQGRHIFGIVHKKPYF